MIAVIKSYMIYSINYLIDKATEKAGTRYQLAKKLAVFPNVIYELEKGKRKLTPKQAIYLAEIAGEDPKEAALFAITEGEKDPTEKERLKKLLLGK